ncbi:glycosyltransferase [Erythrobacter sp. F6033]|uniref:glycosyltransferase n=1 Tax=Erythrobacter sp. F6033 TaxID=2926401 RepID=UPI001FF54AC7|nr:glycosyltransferase [Erythrobacter sp. F6033]
MTSCTVIIPAFNEEAVIARCLNCLLETAPHDHGMEIIVAANGCSDATVRIAGETAPEAIILDLERGSKTGAINAANAIASHYPRIYLDADIECSYSSIMALVNELETTGGMAASPAIRMRLDHSDWLVEAYYRVWLRQPYASSGNGGAGCYALSRLACEEVGEFPDIVGDDIWIHTRFAPDQKHYVDRDKAGDPVFTVVRPPAGVVELIGVEVRKQFGNAEVLVQHPSPHGTLQKSSGGLRTAIKSGSAITDIFVFFAIKLCARAVAGTQRLLGRKTAWSTDQSSRRA